MIAGAVQTIGEAVQMLEAERQEIRGRLAALEQWREITEERQQAMGEYLVEIRERVQALEQRAVSDPSDAVRRLAYRKVDTVVASDVPIIYLYNPTYIYAYRPRLHGFAPNAFGPTWNAYAWRL